jgi:hypothetical protein
MSPTANTIKTGDIFLVPADQLVDLPILYMYVGQIADRYGDILYKFYDIHSSMMYIHGRGVFCHIVYADQ